MLPRRCAAGSRCRCEAVRVEVDVAGGASIEAAARAARYRAFAGRLQPGECLLTAHHAHDQPRPCCCSCCAAPGSRACRRCPCAAPFARAGSCAPAARRRAARTASARCDARGEPARGPDEPRSTLRPRLPAPRRCWPLIEARWPGRGRASLARAAPARGRGAGLLDALGADRVARLRDGDALSVPGLRALPARGACNVLRLLARRKPRSGRRPTARLEEVAAPMLAAQRRSRSPRSSGASTSAPLSGPAVPDGRGRCAAHGLRRCDWAAGRGLAPAARRGPRGACAGAERAAGLDPRRAARSG